MKKTTVIATCLCNSRLVTQLEDGEHFAKEVFEREFPTEDFNQWNLEIYDSTAKDLIGRRVLTLANYWESQMPLYFLISGLLVSPIP